MNILFVLSILIRFWETLGMFVNSNEAVSLAWQEGNSQYHQVKMDINCAMNQNQFKPAPYLMHVAQGRAVIDDYGVELPDGSWALASGTAIKDANGNIIASPTKADILAQAHESSSEWRVENFGFYAFAGLPVANIGIDIVNGMVADYTVRVTDQDGSFYVWTRNLDRALALQAKQGTSLAFNLRNYEVNFVKLQQQVDSSDDSKYRIELLTPAQFSFALKLSSIAFQPQMLVATLNNATGIIAYAVNTNGPAAVSTGASASSIDKMIGLLDPVFKEYVYVSRATAVRMALQGGLSSFAQGLKYDVAQDKYVCTTNKQLAPMFTAILNAAPADNTANATDHYLTKWNEILWEVYPSIKGTLPFIVHWNYGATPLSIKGTLPFIVHWNYGATPLNLKPPNLR